MSCFSERAVIGGRRKGRCFRQVWAWRPAPPTCGWTLALLQPSSSLTHDLAAKTAALRCPQARGCHRGHGRLLMGHPSLGRPSSPSCLGGAGRCPPSHSPITPASHRPLAQPEELIWLILLLLVVQKVRSPPGWAGWGRESIRGRGTEARPTDSWASAKQQHVLDFSASISA